MSLKITPRHDVDKLQTHNIDIGEGAGVLIELSLINGVL